MGIVIHCGWYFLWCILSKLWDLLYGPFRLGLGTEVHWDFCFQDASIFRYLTPFLFLVLRCEQWSQVLPWISCGVCVLVCRSVTLAFFEGLFLSFSFSGVVVRVLVTSIQKLQVEASEVPTMMPGVPFGLFWRVYVCAGLCCLICFCQNSIINISCPLALSLSISVITFAFLCLSSFVSVSLPQGWWCEF